MATQLPTPLHLIATAWRAPRQRLVRVAIVILLIAVQLIHRLALALDYLLFPSFAKVKVERPLFVVGPPRSGTTLLHRLIASQREQFTTTPLWELIFAPAIWQKYLVYGLWICDRSLGEPVTKAVGWLEHKCLYSTRHIHATSLTDPEEDYLVLLLYNACFLLVAAFPDCEAVWRLGYFDEAIDAGTRRRLGHSYRRLVQRHLFFRGSHLCLLSKNPSFCSWIATLDEEFVGARFLAPIREPIQMVPSQLSAMGLNVKNPLAGATAQRFAELLAHYFDAVGSGLDRIPAARRRRLRYSALCVCEPAVLSSVLRRLGYRNVNDEALAQATAHSRQPRPNHRYRLADFGMDATRIRQLFSLPVLQRLEESPMEIVMDQDVPVMPNTHVGVKHDARYDRQTTGNSQFTGIDPG